MSGKFRFKLAELEASKGNAVLQRKLDMTCDRLDKLLSKNNKKHQKSLEACVTTTYDLLEEAEMHEKSKFEEKKKERKESEEENVHDEESQKHISPIQLSLELSARPLTAPVCVLERHRTTKKYNGNPVKTSYRSAVLPFAKYRDKTKSESKYHNLEVIGEAAFKKEEFLEEYYDKYRWAFMSQQLKTKTRQKIKPPAPKLASMNKVAMRAESDRSIRVAKRHIRKSAYLRDKIYRDTVAAVESLDITLCDSD